MSGIPACCEKILGVPGTVSTLPGHRDNHRCGDGRYIFMLFPSMGGSHPTRGQRFCVVRNMRGTGEIAGTIKELDPQIIEVSTSGMKYPASKSDLIARAKESETPQIVLDALNKFEERQYNDPEDVKSEFLKIQNK